MGFSGVRKSAWRHSKRNVSWEQLSMIMELAKEDVGEIPNHIEKEIQKIHDLGEGNDKNSSNNS